MFVAPFLVHLSPQKELASSFQLFLKFRRFRELYLIFGNKIFVFKLSDSVLNGCSVGIPACIS